jgi:hypothetical protein
VVGSRPVRGGTKGVGVVAILVELEAGFITPELGRV